MSIDRASQSLTEPGEEAFKRVVAIHLHLLNQRHPGRRYRLITGRAAEDVRPPAKVRVA